MADAEDYTWHAFHQDEAYIETVAILAGTTKVHESVLHEILSAEERATAALASRHQHDGLTRATMARSVGRVAAMRDFGILAETDL